MKTALILTGLLRYWERSFPSIKREILDVYQPAVYLALWSERGAYQGRNYLQSPSDQYVKLADGDRGFHDSGELINFQDLWDAYRPVGIRIDDFSTYEWMFDEYANDFTRAYTRPKNTAAMFWKIRQGIQMPPNQYEFVIRMRPDLQFNSPLPKMTSEHFYTIRHRNKEGNGTSDSFQAGSAGDMDYFGETFDRLGEWYTTYGYSCPHVFTWATIQAYELPWQELNVEFTCNHAKNGPYSEPV